LVVFKEVTVEEEVAVVELLEAGPDVTNGGDNDDGLYDDKSINGGEGLKLCEC
jgi:hypothetical protein